MVTVLPAGGDGPVTIGENVAANDQRNARTGEYDLDRDNDGVACEKR